MDRAVKYEVKPTKEQVVTDLNQFLAKNPQFNGKLKIGKAKLESITNPTRQNPVRYPRHSKFEFLTLDHIFAICGNERLALDVEKMAREHAKENNLLVYTKDLVEGAYCGDENFTYIVYVTQLKPDTDKCLVCERYVSVGKKKHMEKYHIEIVTEWTRIKTEIESGKWANTEKGKELIGIANEMLMMYNTEEDETMNIESEEEDNDED